MTTIEYPWPSDTMQSPHIPLQKHFNLSSALCQDLTKKDIKGKSNRPKFPFPRLPPELQLMVIQAGLNQAFDLAVGLNTQDLLRHSVNKRNYGYIQQWDYEDLAQGLHEVFPEFRLNIERTVKNHRDSLKVHVVDSFNGVCKWQVQYGQCSATSTFWIIEKLLERFKAGCRCGAVSLRTLHIPQHESECKLRRE